MEFQKALFLSSWVISALKVIYKVKVIKAQMTPDLHSSFTVHSPFSISHSQFSILNLISFSLSLFVKKPSRHLTISLNSFSILNSPFTFHHSLFTFHPSPFTSFSLCKKKSISLSCWSGITIYTSIMAGIVLADIFAFYAAAEFALSFIFQFFIVVGWYIIFRS